MRTYGSIGSKLVKNMVISDGVTYSGTVFTIGDKDFPSGIGICNYNDHYEIGKFSSIESRYGWALNVSQEDFQFGVFEDNVLKVNVSPLVRPFWDKIFKETISIDKRPFYLFKNGVIFVGLPQTSIINGKFGFHFLPNGEVFLGQNEYDQNGITGKFLHFDLNYNITCGEYKDGKLIRKIDSVDLLSDCHVWANHAFVDFNIKMNYAPSAFLLEKKKLLHVVEMGKTPDNIIIKANICEINGNKIECENVIDADSVWFMFPNYIEKELIVIANSEAPWVPNFKDYRVEFFNNFREAKNNHQIVYKHISCWDKNAEFKLDYFHSCDLSDFSVDSDFDIDDNDDNDDEEAYLLRQLVPNFYIKKSQLEEQWLKYGLYYDYPSVKDYVKSLAYDNVNNFLGWLFDDYNLSNTSAWFLPPGHEIALQQFINLFSDLDD